MTYAITERNRLIVEAFETENYGALTELYPLGFTAQNGKIFKRTDPAYSSPALSEAFKKRMNEEISQEEWLKIRDAVPGNLIPIEDLTIETLF